MYYQSMWTSYCAIYSIANLLELYGIKKSIGEIRKSFDWPSRGHGKPVNHKMILNSISKLKNLPKEKLHWKNFKQFNFNKVKKISVKYVNNNIPIVFVYHMVVKNYEVGGQHCAIITGIDDKINILDPRGIRNNLKSNSTIDNVRFKRGWEINGSPDFVTWGGCQLLMGLPPI